MHLADAFIQSNLYCISSTHLHSYQFPGKRTHDLGVASANALLFELQESLQESRNHFEPLNLLPPSLINQGLC